MASKKFPCHACSLMDTFGQSDSDIRFAMQTRRRIQGIFKANDTIVFLLNLALQLANSGADLDDTDALSMKYELSVESAVRLSLAAKLLKDIIPESMIDQPSSTDGPGYTESANEPSSTLFVRNIPPTTPEHEIYSVFQHFGSLRGVRIQKDKNTGQFYG